MDTCWEGGNCDDSSNYEAAKGRVRTFDETQEKQLIITVEDDSLDNEDSLSNDDAMDFFFCKYRV